MKTILVVGASGATGRLLLKQLLDKGLKVKVIVRQPNLLPDDIKHHANLSEIHASVHELTDAEMALHVTGCDAVASCLGHNLTFKGMFGQPRLLVTDTVRRLCRAVQANHPEKMVKFILMNTTGNRNRDIPEQVSFGQACVISLLRLLLPPHLDNEKAADYLRTQVGQHNEAIEWVTVRPDSLTNADAVTEYEVHPSPVRSAIFDAGSTSRINVGHFMAELVVDDDLWNRWKGQMPVIYNKE
ncbi:NAD(P)-dependent oxidoreductase [Sedimenticola sp.]|uniref:NAD(P)-dependent oxidoreductase n=1 Tax=Sedimenticola sp. TaxID=1940285 RepID=UPI002588B589|nr:NAD(P)-binding oxidoreductase [Sedimenticola sp.]MCW8903296.1 SDR family oxidoreductase [Sedimenticola sp.]